MRLFLICLLASIGAMNALAQASATTNCPDPESFFGFRPGADRQLIDYSELIAYLKVLDRASPRIALQQVGTSPLGKPMFVAFFSTPENLERLDALRKINRKLALDPHLEASDLTSLVASGRVFVMATLSMHSTEVAPSQSLPLIAFDWCTTQDADVIEALSNVVMMVIPCHNPDGMDMVVQHYRKTKVTPYEGSSLPGVYHRYVGHDNNRDFITLTQADTQVINDLVCQDWFPQVLVEKHQMGATGPRYFVPPNHDPIAENIDEGLWNWNAIFGTHLAHDMSDEGLSGIASHWLFDNYWPGSTETSLWKNVISFLTEAASCKIARPVFVEPNELIVRGKGLSEYEISTNMPNPWPGGWWRLSDIVAYECASMTSILETAAAHRARILEFRNALCRKEVARGASQAPYFFVLPKNQWDAGEAIALLDLLHRHGVSIHRLVDDVVTRDRVYSSGDFVIPLAQPYRAFIKEVMERQDYPVRHYTPDGEVIRPYDITSWCLPLHRGVEAVTVDEPVIPAEALSARLNPIDWRAAPGEVPDRTWAVALPVRDNSSFRAAFRALSNDLQVTRLQQPLDANGTPLEPGSFVIRSTQKGRHVMDQIAHDPTLRPVFLRDKTTVDRAPVSMPRIALVETFFHDMDAGWTRYLLDTFEIPFTVLRPAELASSDLANQFDVIILPDTDPDVLKSGKLKRGDHYRPVDFPPEYQKGMEEPGLEHIMSFVDSGGTVISWRRSVELFTQPLKIQRSETETETFSLPIEDLSEATTKKGLFVPGACLSLQVRTDHPLGWGLPEQTAAFSRGTPVLQTQLPMLDMDRRVVASFPDSDILLSGYAESARLLAGMPAVVWLKKGRGQMVLMTIGPQFRASTPATYKFLFNAILLPKPQ